MDLTVLMIIKNGFPYCIDAINSVLKQDLKQFKFLIVNNNSTDKTTSYLESLKDVRIKMINNSVTGIVSSLNYGLQHIHTKYTAIMDSDDISREDRLSIQMAVLNENKEIGIIGSDIEYFSNDHGRIWRKRFPSCHSQIKKGLFCGNYVLSHPTVIYKTQLVKNIGSYGKNDCSTPDYNMFCRIVNTAKSANVNKALVKVRIHESSFTISNLWSIEKSKYESVKIFKTSTDKLFKITEFKALKSFSVYTNFLSQKFYKKGLSNYLSRRSAVWLVYFLIASIIKPVKAIIYFKDILINVK